MYWQNVQWTDITTASQGGQLALSYFRRSRAASSQLKIVKCMKWSVPPCQAATAIVIILIYRNYLWDFWFILSSMLVTTSDLLLQWKFNVRIVISVRKHQQGLSWIAHAVTKAQAKYIYLIYMDKYKESQAKSHSTTCVRIIKFHLKCLMSEKKESVS